MTTPLSDEKLSEIRGWWEEWEDFEFEHVAQMFAPATQALQDVPALLDEVDRLRARIAELEAVLRSVEWKGPVESVETEDGYRTARLCPRCLGDRLEDHAPDCALDAVLRDAHD